MKLKDGCTITETDDGAIILDTQSGEYWQVNRTGHALLVDIAHGNSESGLIDNVRQRYPQYADIASADAAELLAQFRAVGLVRNE